MGVAAVVYVAVGIVVVVATNMGPLRMAGKVSSHAVLVKDVIAGVVGIVRIHDRLSDRKIFQTNDTGSGDFSFCCGNSSSSSSTTTTSICSRCSSAIDDCFAGSSSSVFRRGIDIVLFGYSRRRFLFGMM